MTIVARNGDLIVCGHVNGHVLKDIADRSRMANSSASTMPRAR